jgi:hypothetical protein
LGIGGIVPAHGVAPGFGTCGELFRSEPIIVSGFWRTVGVGNLGNITVRYRLRGYWVQGRVQVRPIWLAGRLSVPRLAQVRADHRAFNVGVLSCSDHGSCTY